VSSQFGNLSRGQIKFYRRLLDAADDCAFGESGFNQFHDRIVFQSRDFFKFHRSAGLAGPAQDANGGRASGYSIAGGGTVAAFALRAALKAAAGAEYVGAVAGSRGILCRVVLFINPIDVGVRGGALIEKVFVSPVLIEVDALLSRQHRQNDLLTDAGFFKLNHALRGQIKSGWTRSDNRDDRFFLEVGLDQLNYGSVCQQIVRSGLGNRTASAQVEAKENQEEPKT